MLGDTSNKRVVRIILECILMLHKLAIFQPFYLYSICVLACVGTCEL